MHSFQLNVRSVTKFQQVLPAIRAQWPTGSARSFTTSCRFEREQTRRDGKRSRSLIVGKPVRIDFLTVSELTATYSDHVIHFHIEHYKAQDFVDIIRANIPFLEGYAVNDGKDVFDSTEADDEKALKVGNLVLSQKFGNFSRINAALSKLLFVIFQYHQTVSLQPRMHRTL